MTELDRTVDEYVGRVIRGEYKKREQRLTDLAERAGIPYVTLQRKVNGNSAFTAAELIAVSKAMIPPLDYGAVLHEAERLYAAMSHAPSTTDDITKKRQDKEAEARAMSPESLEMTKNAATRDDEYGTDEPPAP